jgi:hypothetical protein
MLRTLLKAWTLGLTAYTLVYTREVPPAYAQTVVNTDCSTELDQPDTTYRLTGNVARDCIIAANNIILDGAGFIIGRDIIASSTVGALNSTVQDVTVQRDVHWFEGDIAVIEAMVERWVGMYGNDGSITITDSTVVNGVWTNYDGNITFTNSTVVDQGIWISEYGTITIEDSTTNYAAVYGNGTITIEDSTVGGNGGWNGYAVAGTACTITDSVVTNPAVVDCETLTLTDNPQTSPSPHSHSNSIWVSPSTPSPVSLQRM